MNDERKKIISQESDRCVRCGLCVPLCPTYMISKQESESPRGRIALFKTLTENQVLDNSVADALNHCVGCMRCEAVCPSEVNYSDILHEGKILLNQLKKSAPTPIWLKIFLLITTNHFLNKVFYQTLKFYQKTLLRFTKIKLKPTNFYYQDFLPKLTNYIPFKKPQKNINAKKIALFRGCVTNLLDRQTLNDTASWLTDLGYDVEFSDFGCCGALMQHQGDELSLQKQVKKNQRAIADKNYFAVINCASGCHQALQLAMPNKTPVFEMQDFLLQHLEQLKFQSYAKRVVIQPACSQANQLKNLENTKKLLQLVPDLQVLMPTQFNCCGAAGIYFLQYPDKAAQLGEQHLENLLDLNPDVIISNNFGCTLQLSAHIKKQGLHVEMQSLVSFLYLLKVL